MIRKLNSVLLIDDDGPTNYLNKIIIEELQCADHIEIATSARAAINLLTAMRHSDAKKFFPDLIFLDINMPGMDGWEFLSIYRDLNMQHEGKSVIVILTTSLNPDDEIRSKQMKEVYAFKQKPLSRKTIHQILEQYF